MEAPSNRETSRRRWLLPGVLAAIILASRLVALSSSPWEWDEALFVSAVGEYDIRSHRPHPPGYPLFIAAAKLVRPLVSDNFRALQSITLVGAWLLPLALWGLLKRLGFPRFVSVGSALVISFIPVIWFYGGTAFSDVPALTVTIFAAFSLVTGRRDWRTDLTSGLLIAAVAGFRPQNLLIVAPFFVHAIALSERRWRNAVQIGGVATLAVVATYVSAFVASGSLSESVDAIGSQAHYVVEVDSMRNPIRPPVSTAWEDFILDSYPTDAIAWILFVLAAVGLVRGLKTHPGGVTLLVIAFVPLAIVSIYLFDVQAAERYSVSYVALVGILAVVGIDTIATTFPSQSWRRVVSVGLLFACVVSLAWRSWLAIEIHRTSLTPPMAALTYAMESAGADGLIAIDRGLEPFARAYVPEYEVVDEYSGDPREGYLIETDHTVAEVTHFTVEQETLKRIARRRYFDIWVTELDRFPQFGEGWYDLEWDGRNRTASRWMSGSGAIGLPAGTEARCAVLRFHLPSQIDSEGVTGQITGGNVTVERLGNELTMRVRLLPCEGCLRNLQLAANTFVPADFGSDDRRELGALLTSISVNDCD